MKTCVTCGEQKPEDEFYRRGASGRRNDCKECSKARSKAAYEKNGERVKRRVHEYQKANPERVQEWRKKGKPHWDRKAKYGLEKEDYELLLIAQSGRCAICLLPMLNPCVDHCHATGRVRGLLCKDCNTGIGHLKDDIERLRAAIEYLGTFVPVPVEVEPPTGG